MSVIMSKIFTLPSNNISVSNIEVGSSVYLNVDGVKTEFLVVHQGNPNSSLYDASCDGTWLLMKDIYEKRVWRDSTSDADRNSYKVSDIHAYLNDTFLNLFDNDIKAQIMPVKIPYVNGTGSGGSIASGSNGLSTQIFLLSGYEVGWTQSTDQYFPIDGVCLDYFRGTSSYDSKRVAYMNGAVTTWWLRSPYTQGIGSVWNVGNIGATGIQGCYNSLGIRPAFILDSSAKIDSDTFEIVG